MHCPECAPDLCGGLAAFLMPAEGIREELPQRFDWPVLFGLRRAVWVDLCLQGWHAYGYARRQLLRCGSAALRTSARRSGRSSGDSGDHWALEPPFCA